MIVSFSRRFAFVAIPRTGTHAVREALRPLLAPTDWEQCTRYERRVCPVPQIATIGHGHLSAPQLAQFLLPGMWEDLFSFAFLRDPLQRFVSAYCLLNRNGLSGSAAMLEDMNAVFDDPRRVGHVLYRPQAEFVLDLEGNRKVTFLGLQSQLATGLTSVFARLGLSPPVLNRPNSAAHPVGFQPDAHLIERVRAHYSADYDLLETVQREQSDAE